MDQSEIVFSRLNDGWTATFSVRCKESSKKAQRRLKEGSKKAQRRLKEGWTWLQQPSPALPAGQKWKEEAKPNQYGFYKFVISLTNQVIKYCSTGNCVKLGQTWIHSDSKTNPVHQKTFSSSNGWVEPPPISNKLYQRVPSQAGLGGHNIQIQIWNIKIIDLRDNIQISNQVKYKYKYKISN